MLKHIIQTTNKYVDACSKAKRKNYGQFFTSMETSKFMASLFDLNKTDVTILDPGAGSGILSAAVIERINNVGSIKNVSLTCYENDENIIPLLKQNLEYIKQCVNLNFQYNIIAENYILYNSDDFVGSLYSAKTPLKWDLIISNPPYMKLRKTSPEASAMASICHGAPNLYSIFASMSLFNLKENGEMVYIIPRSWTSGAYFKYFREYLLDEGKLTNIHLFTSRDKVFENVLQEIMIIKIIGHL